MRHVFVMSLSGLLLFSTQASAQQTRPSRQADNTSSRDIRDPRMTGAVLRDRFERERYLQNPRASALQYGNSLQTAKCIVRISGDRAASLVGGADTPDPRYAKLNSAMNGRLKACARDGVDGMSPSVLSSAIAERLIVQDNGLQDRADGVDSSQAQAFHGDLKGSTEIAGIARCVAVYSPGLARKVMETEVGSAAEGSALEAAYTQTPECGVTRTPTNIAASFQRAALADGLFKWKQRGR